MASTLLILLLLVFVALAGLVLLAPRRKARALNPLAPHARVSVLEAPTPLPFEPTPTPVTVDAGAQVRPLSSEELVGVAANLYAARGFTLVRQELGPQGAELLMETPNQSRVLVRCVPSSGAPLDAAALDRVSSQTGTGNTVLVTPGDVSDDARGLAKQRAMELVDGPRLLRLLRVYLPGAAEALRLVSRTPQVR